MVTRNVDQRKKMEEERESLIRDLNQALASIKTLSGLISTCASCKRIRNSKGEWEQMNSISKNIPRPSSPMVYVLNVRKNSIPIFTMKS